MKRREFLKSAAAAGATIALPTAGLAQGTGIQSKNSEGSVADRYPLGPDSKRQSGVPSGKLFNFLIDDSRIFAGTQRTIDVYVPAQYTGKRPACVMVALDGLSETLPIVFDNLIQKKEMPVTIAIGLHSGTNPSAHPPQNPRFNRSFEFDSLSSRLAEFITEEMLPAVEQRKTPDGQPILLSRNPNDRGIMGASTGGIGSFTAAWQRPDAFRRVYTMIGTFVGMRGGDRYPVLIRKTEPKPIRIFMQDGDKDGWPGGLELGDWWMSNQEVERALTFAGYEVNHAWGVLGHEGSHGESILPDVMRWLWKDWPQPVKVGQSKNFAIQAIQKPGENWEMVVNDQISFAIVSNRKGRIYFQNASDGNIYRIGANNQLEKFTHATPGSNGLAFGPDGRLYVAEMQRERILVCSVEGKSTVIAENVRGNGLTVAHNGNIYVTESADSSTGRVWLIQLNGTKSIIAEGLHGPTGISLTPDGLWLCVAEGEGHHAYSYQVQPDGKLQYGEPFYWFHVPDTANNSGVGQVCMDRQGWMYAATRMGVQVFDRNGRVTAIFPLAAGPLKGICFSGPDFQTLYVTTGNAIYRRNVKTTGMPPWEAPIVLPAWSAG